MDELNIKAILKVGESLTVEFKSSFGRETIESLVAFSNAQGGTVLIGVADDGSVRGTTIGRETLNDWLGQIKSGTSPSIIPDIDSLQIEGKLIVVICISEYPVKPVNTKGHYFKRVASSNHLLGLSEITDLYLQSLQISWDAHEAHGESLDELSVEKIEKFIEPIIYEAVITIDIAATIAIQGLSVCHTPIKIGNSAIKPEKPGIPIETIPPTINAIVGIGMYFTIPPNLFKSLVCACPYIIPTTAKKSAVITP